MAKDKEVEQAADEMITVKASQLQEVLDQVKAQGETIANLTASVNQNKLTQVINSKKPKELPRMFLKVFRGKVVVGWRTAAARYVYGNSGSAPISEVLQSTYNFLDGTVSEAVDQALFTQENTRLWCRMQEGLKAIQDPEVKEWTLVAEQLESSDSELINSFVMPTEPIKIDRNFVNP